MPGDHEDLAVDQRGPVRHVDAALEAIDDTLDQIDAADVGQVEVVEEDDDLTIRGRIT